MEKRDYYETLGVSKGAGEGEVKSAYRKMAMQFHPDKNPGNDKAEHRFKEISEAYQILKDPQKKAAYDQFGHAAFKDGGHGTARGGFDFSGGSFSDVFEDLFGDFTGRSPGQQQSSAQRGADLRYNFEVTLEEAFKGTEADIEIPTTQTCGDCSGSGAAAGSLPEVCSTCSGHGKVRTQQGFFTVERTCPSCQGVGHIISNPCGSCHGAGHVEKEKSLSVKIPKGVEEGTRIRLSGEGEAGFRGGPSGDLYIFVNLIQHELFQRDGTTLYCQVPITMTTATLGGEIEVPTIDGKKAIVKIKEGAQSGSRIRLRQKGMPKLQSSLVGDMVLETIVETPTNLSKKQKGLLKEFEGEAKESWSPQSAGFFSKVKNIWEELTD
ncbi:MAG: molecular chaperone DnaJ [Sphingomonadales bacterium]